MEYMIIIWLITILISCCTNVINYMRKFKDAADRGYKINIIKLETIEREIAAKNKADKSIVSPELFLNLIPIINLMASIIGIIEYNKRKPMLMEYYEKIRVLARMSKSERKEYLRHRNVFKAYMISATNERLTFLQDLRPEDPGDSLLEFVDEENVSEENSGDVLEPGDCSVLAQVNVDDVVDTSFGFLLRTDDQVSATDDVASDEGEKGYTKKIGERNSEISGHKKN